MIRLAKENDIESMVELFISYINNSFFVELGRTFLRPFLEALVQSNCTLKFVYIIDSQIIGFIFSTYDNRRLFKEMLIKKGMIFGTMALSSILKKPAILKGLLGNILYAQKIMADTVRAEFLFIAIEPEYRLRGVATEFINHTLAELKKRGVQKVRVSTEQSNAAVNKVLQKLNFELMSSFQVFGKKLFLYNRII